MMVVVAVVVCSLRRVSPENEVVMGRGAGVRAGERTDTGSVAGAGVHAGAGKHKEKHD